MKLASQCDRVLAVLEDGLPHTISEIHERAGTMRLNSRVAELRGRLKASGETIVCSREGDTYSYQLLSLGPAESVVSSAGPSEGGMNQATGSGSPQKQPLSLDSSGESQTLSGELAGGSLESPDEQLVMDVAA